MNDTALLVVAAVLVLMGVLTLALVLVAAVKIRRTLQTDREEEEAGAGGAAPEAEAALDRRYVATLERETAEERLRAEQARRRMRETQEEIEQMRLAWITSQGPKHEVREGIDGR